MENIMFMMTKVTINIFEIFVILDLITKLINITFDLKNTSYFLSAQPNSEFFLRPWFHYPDYKTPIKLDRCPLNSTMTH